jgi:predicted nucleic acid-binding protein
VVIYAESSAVLSWLFGERRAVEVIETLESAEVVVASELTGVECARAIQRVASRGLIGRVQAATLLAEFGSAAAQWDRIEVRERVIGLASGPFPVEPIRALDAIHLASAMVAREVWPELAVLSFDERVRANAAALGHTVLPETI